MVDKELLDDSLAQGNAPEREPIREDFFAKSVDPEFPFGVLYQGEWETPFDGTAVAVRAHARALADAGMPVVLKSFSNVVVSPSGVIEPVPVAGIPDEVKREVRNLHLTRVGSIVPMVKHAVIPNATKLAQLLMRGVAGPLDKPELRMGAQQAVYSSSVVYSVWERSAIHPDVALHLSEVAECWVPCEHNKELLTRAGVQRVRVVPHPYDPTEMVNKCTLRRPHSPSDKRFYAIGSWQPRKGFHELVGAFLRQFCPDDSVRLTIKYSGGQWPGYPEPDRSVPQWLEDPEVRAKGWTPELAQRRVALIGGRLSRSKIVELHYRNNVYVCSSKGEAWCLPAFDAKLAGNRLVHVPYGGTADFAGPGDVAVEYSMRAVPASYGWEPDAEWADYELMDLSLALARARVPDRFQAPADFDERFSRHAVGAQMREALIKLTDSLHDEAASYYRSRYRSGE